MVVQPEDNIPAHLTTFIDAGLEVMARDEQGWCVAVDAAHMHCSIYDSRPEVCRRFVMGGPYCKSVRANYIDRTARWVPLELFRGGEAVCHGSSFAGLVDGSTKRIR